MNRFISCLLFMAGMIHLNACLQPSDSDIQPSYSKPFKGEDLVKTMEAQPELQLFTQAFKRAALGNLLMPNQRYTILAINNAGMEAAGLTTAVINTLSADSLKRLITYHMLDGGMDTDALKDRIFTVMTPTLRSDTINNPQTGQSLLTPTLYLTVNSNIYLNDILAGQHQKGIEATNGFVYTVNLLAKPIQRKTLRQLVDADPELNLYREALKIGDSIRDAAITEAGWGGYSVSDTALFSNLPDISSGAVPEQPTILAPTDAAFHKAGLHTVDDIRAFALSHPSYVYLDEATYYMTLHYSPLDSMLKRHQLYNTGRTFIVLYGDLMQPAINNGKYNTFLQAILMGPYNSMKYPTDLFFSANGGNVQVRWGNGTGEVAAIRRKPGNEGLAANGVLYKTDQLFYKAQ